MRALAFDRPADFDVTVTVAEPLPQLRPEVEIAAFRTLSEAVSNAARHSQGHHCDVRVASNGTGSIVLEVVDDGIGVCRDSSGVGLGLRSMEEMADRVGGRIVVEPVSPHGTRVLATFPTG